MQHCAIFRNRKRAKVREPAELRQADEGLQGAQSAFNFSTVVNLQLHRYFQANPNIVDME